MRTFLLPFTFIFLLLFNRYPAEAKQYVEKIIHASWYECCHKTANGEKFNPDGMTAAHKYLRFGTKVELRNLKTGKKIIVRINDRGPFVKGRELDLSRGAARKLGVIGQGVSKIAMRVLN